MTHFDDHFRERADLTGSEGSGGSGGSSGGSSGSSGGTQAATLTPARELKEGDIVNDRYRILSFIGKGAMGSVYKVEHVLLKKHFALKTLNTISSSSTVFRRFQKEAEAAGKLEHPNLVRAIDFGLIDGNQPYFVMDVIRGRNLSRHLKKNGKLTIEEALDIFIPICQAVDYAHDWGIVHRDIKPSNIVLESSHSGKFIPKVVDFGIAKIDDDGQGLTKTGEIFGTPMYMSPEQCMGASVDKRSDIYSLGCVLYEALTGASPFKGSTALETMMMHRTGEPLSLREASLGCDFPADLEKVVAKMLAKDPADRYQRCSDIAVDLERLAAGKRIVGEVDSKTEATSKKKQQKQEKNELTSPSRRLLWIALPVILLVGAGGYFLVHHNLHGTKFGAAKGTLPDQIDASQPPSTTQTTSPGPGSISEAKDKDASKEQKGDMIEEIQSLGLKGQGGLLSTVLASHSDLTDISISTLLQHQQVKDEVLSALKGRTNVASLNLNDEKLLTDQCLQYIVHLPLRRLCLKNTQIDDTGLKEIATRLHLLEELDLSYTHISSAGLSYLKDLKYLKTIAVSTSAGNDDGLANLGRLQSLRSIEVKRGTFTEKGLAKLSELNDLNTLSLVSEGTISAAALRTIGQFKTLSNLSLEGMTITDENALKNLARLPLTNLNISNTKIRDASLKYLSSIRALRELDLSENDITNSALAPISKLPLSKLILRKTKLANDGGLSELSNSQIVSLDLSDTAIDGRALLEYVPGMKHLQLLTISHCSSVTQKDLTSLREKLPALSIGY